MYEKRTEAPINKKRFYIRLLKHFLGIFSIDSLFTFNRNFWVFNF